MRGGAADPPGDLARLDRAQDRVRVPGRLDLDPGAPEVFVPVPVVGGDLGKRDRVDVVLRLVDPGVGDLHRVDRQAVARDGSDAPGRLLHGERVAGPGV